MGYTTDFVGHLDIRPHLNEAETTYLEAFRRTRHCERGGSPYDVAANPWAPDRTDLPVERLNRLGHGKPQLYCQWSFCADGCCVSYDGREKFYAPTAWLRYLIDHLLRPGAMAQGCDHPMLRDFTFDHRLDGVVVGCRRDNRELKAIVVEDNVVQEVVIRAGEPEYLGEDPLAYHQVLDREREARWRRADSPAARARRLADVVPLVPARRSP